ncbi:hypothetical protein [Thermodesulfatator autotrophicus]|uniref:Uncharacterized protein n=1 Tax=Thermodesulfatator autotrophicus TaxID=1795632 RepID=A0A177E8R1_9BACT|nr:hypothetical protein [Thermodesulfatator autotrophicus]OAG28344.1 hypothetical protein TH606_02465 [Thermodesulfatator autotrophicus]
MMNGILLKATGIWIIIFIIAIIKRHNSRKNPGFPDGIKSGITSKRIIIGHLCVFSFVDFYSIYWRVGTGNIYFNRIILGGSNALV